MLRKSNEIYFYIINLYSRYKEIDTRIIRRWWCEKVLSKAEKLSLCAYVKID